MLPQRKHSLGWLEKNRNIREVVVSVVKDVAIDIDACPGGSMGEN